MSKMNRTDQIAGEWRQRAAELADWTYRHLLNRTDVWGRYLGKPPRDAPPGSSSQAVTAPFRDERGKVALDRSSLEKHYRLRKAAGVLGVHSSSADRTSRWLAIDVDRHDPEEFGVTPEANFAAMRTWHERLRSMGFDPLLMDSNGIGGFHLLVLFATPMDTASVHRFGRRLVEDYERLGLDRQPEVFPGKPAWTRYGDWLRLPGRHHTREHYTRVWNDEPWAENEWMEGHDAIERIMRAHCANAVLAEQHGIEVARRTICLDFDGVLHSYRSGWQGIDVIDDPPIHGARQAVITLRKSFRVVVYSTRCQTDAGIAAIQRWLAEHDIHVDEVCPHKPPAIAYVDDRAVSFRGDWNETLVELYQRK